MTRFRRVALRIFRPVAPAPGREPVMREGELDAFLAEIRSSYPKPRAEPVPARKPRPWWRKFWPFEKV